MAGFSYNYYLNGRNSRLTLTLVMKGCSYLNKEWRPLIDSVCEQYAVVYTEYHNLCPLLCLSAMTKDRFIDTPNFADFT